MSKKITVKPGTRVVVLHRYFGCDTGCCGHAVYLCDPEILVAKDILYAGEEVPNSFTFSHPYHAGDKLPEDLAKQFARGLVESTLGAEHIKDLDWEHCEIYDY